MSTSEFTIQDIWNLRIACSEMRERWSNYYLESLSCNSESVKTAKSIYEEYSDLYQRLVLLTTNDHSDN